MPSTRCLRRKKKGTFAAMTRANHPGGARFVVSSQSSHHPAQCAPVMASEMGLCHACGNNNKRTVNNGMAVARHIGREHAISAIGHLARQPSILARQRRTTPCPFQKPHLVNDETASSSAQGFSACNLRAMSRNPSASTGRGRDRLVAVQNLRSAPGDRQRVVGASPTR